MRHTYGVFYRLQGPQRADRWADHYLDRWALVRNRRRAIAYAREVSGVVGVMRNDPLGTPWDAPTFRALMEPVADYTGAWRAR